MATKYDVAPISADVIAKLRTLRKILGVSAQDMADRMTELGFPVLRSTLANAECGRKAALTLDYAAQALGTDLAALMANPVACPSCKGEPPIGFTCNVCGTTA